MFEKRNQMARPITQILLLSSTALFFFLSPALADEASISKIDELQKKLEKQDQLIKDLKLENQRLAIDLASIRRDALWESPEVHVCWEDRGYEEEKGWVRYAVASTWAKESALRFVGWDLCTTDMEGIHIRFKDEANAPHVERLGKLISGVTDGMVLNPSFENWSRSCSYPESTREFCIKAISAHEFGHALGFAHEQNREDAPPDCQKERQGTKGDWNVTIYDPDSIMNYCNNEWNNGGQLSPLDIDAVRKLYGNPKGKQ